MEKVRTYRGLLEGEDVTLFVLPVVRTMLLNRIVRQVHK